MKKLIPWLLAVILLLCAGVTVFAADGKVSYDGRAREFIFEPGSEHSPTDLFPNFKGVMPGDTLTQKITVKNDAANNVKVKIYLRSLGAHADSAAFLSQLGLKVQISADNKMAYMFDAAADQTAQLTDWVCLGTLYSGGTVDLDAILEVPVTLDNTFKNQVGLLDWEFKIEEYPVESGDPKPPFTGQISHIRLWIALMLCSLLALIVLWIVWKKIKQKQKNDAKF